MALGAVLLEVFLANMPPPEESQLNLNKSQLGIQEDKKTMGILWVLHGVRFPIFGNLLFFSSFS
jgi:hypothetical protein